MRENAAIERLYDIGYIGFPMVAGYQPTNAFAWGAVIPPRCILPRMFR